MSRPPCIGLPILAALLLSAGCRQAAAPEPSAPTAPAPASAPSVARTSVPSAPPLPVPVPAPALAAVSLPRPVLLRVDPPLLRLARGEKARVKVMAVREGYPGPLDVELRNLPAQVTARKTTLAAGASALDIELTAGAEAPLGPKNDVQALASLTAGVTQPVTPAVFAVEITAPSTPPFSLRVSPDSVRLARGGRVKFKVTATRQGYPGPIDVALRNLPTGVEGKKALIPAGKDEVQVELTANATASLGARKDVTIVGTRTEPAGTPGQPIVSPTFTLNVRKADAQDFSLRVQPGSLRVNQGGRATLTVVADRRGYQGPIAVELRSLPARVTATKGVIAEGATSLSLEVAATTQAARGDKFDVFAQGKATAAGNRLASSPPFTITVQGHATPKRVVKTVVKPAPRPRAHPATPHPKTTPHPPKPRPKPKPAAPKK